jgi:PAS domain S-box-containing protein
MSDLPSENKLLPDKHLYGTLMDSIRGVVWEADPLTFQFSYVSPHAERILDYPAQQWIDDPDFWRTHTHPDDVEWTSTYCRDASSKGLDHEFQYRMIAADGRIVWLHDIVTVMRSDDGIGRLRGIMFDITESKNQQIALLEETAHWQMMMERSHDGIVIIDVASSAVRDVNPAFAEMLGYQRNEMLNMHPWDWDLRFTKEEIEAMPAKHTAGDFFFETRMRCKNGMTRNVEVSSTLTEFSGEYHSFCICRDITERKWAENEIRRDKALLRCLIDSVGDLIYIKDVDGVYQACNKAAEEFIGLPESEQIGKTDFDFFGRDIAEKIRECDREILASGKEGRLEEWVTSRNGKKGLFDTIKAPFYDPDGKPLGLAGIARDITERKWVELTLCESEELFHTLCDSAPIGIFRTDVDGNYIYCSPGWVRITGMSVSEGMGMGWVKGIHPDDLEEQQKVWDEAITAEQIFSHEYRRLTPQGKTIWVRTLANPVKSLDGKISGFVGTMEEITELHQARQDMLKNQKIESLGVLAGGIAHDFNNILTIILGNVSLGRLQVNDPEKVTKQLEKAEKATVRAKDLAQQLLTFARGGEPVKKIIEVRGLLKETAGFALHGSNARGEFVLADDLWPVKADEGQLRQGIQNLVLNAIQAMPEGGTVTIRAENAISSSEGKRFVKISVADTGAGISEHHLHRIFDPYFTTKQQGSGLGLATCYSIIRKHGGKIIATSTLGKGSTFHISLPASEQERVSVPNSQITVSHGSGRVLVMDDEEDIREFTQALLTELDYMVESVENGTEAIDLFRKRKEEGTPFSAVILDLTIPGGVGGKEAIEKLLRIDPDIKAIVSSGYSTDPIMANYRDYGFSAVLVKPYRAQELSMVLQELLVS